MESSSSAGLSPGGPCSVPAYASKGHGPSLPCLLPSRQGLSQRCDLHSFQTPSFAVSLTRLHQHALPVVISRSPARPMLFPTIARKPTPPRPMNPLISAPRSRLAQPLCSEAAIGQPKLSIQHGFIHSARLRSPPLPALRTYSKCSRRQGAPLACLRNAMVPHDGSERGHKSTEASTLHPTCTTTERRQA
jgi:hypothetical protein